MLTELEAKVEAFLKRPKLQDLIKAVSYGQLSSLNLLGTLLAKEAGIVIGEACQAILLHVLLGKLGMDEGHALRFRTKEALGNAMLAGAYLSGQLVDTTRNNPIQKAGPSVYTLNDPKPDWSSASKPKLDYSFLPAPTSGGAPATNG
jgi:hypothetical protein